MNVEGQLWPAERDALYTEVLAARPALVLEVGTWKGGGSTLQIVQALERLGSGHLHTSEVDPSFHAQACRIYHNTSLARFITLHLQPSHEVIAGMVAAGTPPDFTFFDGPEDAQVALDDFKTLDRILLPGAKFAMHDWEHGQSVKQQLIRPYLEAHAGWRIYRLLRPPESVGLVFAEKL